MYKYLLSSFSYTGLVLQRNVFEIVDRHMFWILFVGTVVAMCIGIVTQTNVFSYYFVVAFTGAFVFREFGVIKGLISAERYMERRSVWMLELELVMIVLGFVFLVMATCLAVGSIMYALQSCLIARIISAVLICAVEALVIDRLSAGLTKIVVTLRSMHGNAKK